MRWHLILGQSMFFLAEGIANSSRRQRSHWIVVDLNDALTRAHRYTAAQIRQVERHCAVARPVTSCRALRTARHSLHAKLQIHRRSSIQREQYPLQMTEPRLWASSLLRLLD